MNERISKCSECESEYFTDRSEMAGLCPECSHKLYDYKNCDHELKNGRCSKCYWDGTQSEYFRKN
jgi:predicted RNA-binding Zn-ribbon protein involved in translation (DUF1610 family)